jgi:hypothetical protein
LDRIHSSLFSHTRCVFPPRARRVGVSEKFFFHQEMNYSPNLHPSSPFDRTHWITLSAYFGSHSLVFILTHTTRFRLLVRSCVTASVHVHQHMNYVANKCAPSPFDRTHQIASGARFGSHSLDFILSHTARFRVLVLCWPARLGGTSRPSNSRREPLMVLWRRAGLGLGTRALSPPFDPTPSSIYFMLQTEALLFYSIEHIRLCR